VKRKGLGQRIELIHPLYLQTYIEQEKLTFVHLGVCELGWLKKQQEKNHLKVHFGDFFTLG
jgi:hypothetical protein